MWVLLTKRRGPQLGSGIMCLLAEASQILGTTMKYECWAFYHVL